jgi:hypothetical protein
MRWIRKASKKQGASRKIEAPFLPSGKKFLYILGRKLIKAKRKNKKLSKNT